MAKKAKLFTDEIHKEIFLFEPPFISAFGSFKAARVSRTPVEIPKLKSSRVVRHQFLGGKLRF